MTPLRFSACEPCWQLTFFAARNPTRVAQQLQIPPLEWIQVSLTLDVGERAAYDAALADLRTSYEAFARAVDASSNSREAQARLDESRRRRGLEARDYTGAGALSLLQQARKLGELNGALTRCDRCSVLRLR